MTGISLFESAAGFLRASATGIEIGVLGTLPADPIAASLAFDSGLVLEQGLADATPNGSFIPWESWGSAIALGARSLTLFSRPSPFLLEVDRLSELGRPDFRYVLRWCSGNAQRSLTRVGAYLTSDEGEFYHLDAHTLAIAHTAESFNALPTDLKREPRRAFASLAVLLEHSDTAAAVLERHLSSNLVVVPASIGLRIREDSDGAVTFLPVLPDRSESAAFTQHFDRSLHVQDVETVTTADGRRVRLLFSDAQKEVLNRMRSARRVSGEDGRRISDNPASVFDGLTDVIDLSDIDREYGPRVIGIGALQTPKDHAVKGGSTIFEKMGVSATDGDASPPGSSAPSTPRTAVSVDLVDSESGQAQTVRLGSQEEIAQLREAAASAVARGEADFAHAGKRYRAEPALIEALDQHIAPTSGQHGDIGSVGENGHLYLLINEHEESLTDALLVPDTDAVDEAEAREVLPPAALRHDVSLKDHQREGISWLATVTDRSNRRGGILADDMGLGKTLQLLAHIARQIEAGALLTPEGDARFGPWRPVLIIAPLLLVETDTWPNEMRSRFADDGQIFEPWVVLRDEGLRKVRSTAGGRDFLGKPILDPARIMAHKVVITTYETLLAYQHSLAQRVNGQPMWSLVIFDEAQEIKSPKAKVSIAAKAVDASFKIAATGTPVETRLRDLWNLLDTVEPTVLGTQQDFVTSYERPAMNAASAEERSDALDRLRFRLRYKKIDALLLRRDKTILTGLPKKIEHRVPCPVTSLERDTLQDALRELRAGISGKAALRVLNKLHLTSQHPVLAGAPGDPFDVEWLVSTSSRLQSLLQILEDVRAKGEKALIFARSVDAQRMLSMVVSQRFGVPVDVINGQTGLAGAGHGVRAGVVRKSILDRFQSSAGFGVIVLSPFVAGVGLTITAANHVVHYGRWWNPAVEGQATDRAYRIGQTKDVHVYYPISVDSSGSIERTFDEALDNLISSRRALATDFLHPGAEDADGQKLAGALVGSSDSADQPNLADISSLPERARRIISEFRNAGIRYAWLGGDGMLGIHILASRDDEVAAIRLRIRGDESSLVDAERSALLWGRRLNTASIAAIVVGSNGEIGGTINEWWRVRLSTALSSSHGDFVLTDEPVASVTEITKRLLD